MSLFWCQEQGEETGWIVKRRERELEDAIEVLDATMQFESKERQQLQ